MKKRLRFMQGPFAGQDVDVDEDEAVIQNYLDTGYCEEAEDAPAEVVPVVVAPEPEEKAPEPAPEPKKEAAPKKAAPKKKRIRRKRETPEG